MIDITPHDAREEAILFLPDGKVIYAGTPIPSNRIALTKSKLVERFIQLYKKWDDMAYLDSATDAKLDSIGRELLEIRNKFNRPASRCRAFYLAYSTPGNEVTYLILMSGKLSTNCTVKSSPYSTNFHSPISSGKESTTFTLRSGKEFTT